ncbi:hypothetical protein JCM8547_004802 [Rhodosporidiobolus lusitaniae]
MSGRRDSSASESSSTVDHRVPEHERVDVGDLFPTKTHSRLRSVFSRKRDPRRPPSPPTHEQLDAQLADRYAKPGTWRTEQRNEAPGVRRQMERDSHGRYTQNFGNWVDGQDKNHVSHRHRDLLAHASSVPTSHEALRHAEQTRWDLLEPRLRAYDLEFLRDSFGGHTGAGQVNLYERLTPEERMGIMKERVKNLRREAAYASHALEQTELVPTHSVYRGTLKTLNASITRLVASIAERAQSVETAAHSLQLVKADILDEQQIDYYLAVEHFLLEHLAHERLEAKSYMRQHPHEEYRGRDPQALIEDAEHEARRLLVQEKTSVGHMLHSSRPLHNLVERFRLRQWLPDSSNGVISERDYWGLIYTQDLLHERAHAESEMRDPHATGAQRKEAEGILHAARFSFFLCITQSYFWRAIESNSPDKAFDAHRIFDDVTHHVDTMTPAERASVYNSLRLEYHLPVIPLRPSSIQSGSSASEHEDERSNHFQHDDHDEHDGRRGTIHMTYSPPLPHDHEHEHEGDIPIVLSPHPHRANAPYVDRDELHLSVPSSRPQNLRRPTSGNPYDRLDNNSNDPVFRAYHEEDATLAADRLPPLRPEQGGESKRRRERFFGAVKGLRRRRGSSGSE